MIGKLTEAECVVYVEGMVGLAALAGTLPHAELFETLRAQRIQARAEGASVAEVSVLDAREALCDHLEQLAQLGMMLRDLTRAERIEQVQRARSEAVKQLELIVPPDFPDDWVQK